MNTKEMLLYEKIDKIENKLIELESDYEEKVDELLYKQDKYKKELDKLLKK